MKITHYLTKWEWGLGAIALVFIVAQVFLDLRLPDYMSEVTRLIATPDSELSEVLREGSFMLLCALGSMIAAIVTGYCVAVIGTTLARRLRKAVFDTTLSFSSAELGKFSTTSLITRATNDVTQVQMFVVMGVQILIKSPILAVWALLKISGKGGEWTVATAIAVAALMAIMGTIVALVTPRMMRIQRITDDLNRVTREHLTGLRVIRAYNSQKFHSKRFARTNEELTGTQIFVNYAFSFMMPALTAIMSSLSLAIYLIGASVINGADDPMKKVEIFSNMIVFMSYAMQIIGAFMMLAFIFVMMPRARVSMRRIREVLTTQPQIVSGVARVGRSDRLGTVEFKNVTFRFPDAEDDALRNVSFEAGPGETVAIIGSTGAGKSALVNLVPRFYDVREGQILVDGRDVREWDLASLRTRISHVGQKATLFSGTVASNIKYGNAVHEITSGDVVDAAEISNASEFIEAKEDLFASSVAQAGSNFSGGQKQRMSIARGVARDGQIMIFDDSFSALDYKTDRDVRAALRQASQGATMLIVSQRIGTVRGADTILVVDEGRIVGAGTHAELLASCEVYRAIALSQLSEEELA